MAKKNKRLKKVLPKINVPKSQVSPTPTKSISVYLKGLWVFVTVISLFYNFWLSSFSLSPNVFVSYSTNIPIENNFALPLQISNNSIFAIKNVRLEIVNSLSSDPFISFTDNTSFEYVSDEISPNESRDYIFNHLKISPMLTPTEGKIIFNVHYKYSLFNLDYIYSKTFFPYLDANNKVKWLSK